MSGEARACARLMPLRAKTSVWLATAALFGIYVATMARDLSLYDSGELALAAVQLGLGHPPGQPLHTLLGFVLSHIPFIPKLAGACLASALPGALALVPATSIAQTLVGRDTSIGALRAIPWALALIALHPLFWEPATRVEVYSLAVFFALLAFATLAAPATHGDRSDRAPRFLRAGVALGLAASANPMIALGSALSLAPRLLAQALRGRLSWRACAFAVIGGVLGLLPYLYLAIIVHRTDVMVWGAPRDFSSLMHYVTLRDYAPNQHVSFAMWSSHVSSLAGSLLEHYLAPLMLLGAAGFVVLGPRTELGRLPGLLVLALLGSVEAFQAIWALDVPDYNGYLATGMWLLASGAVALCAVLRDRGHGLAAPLLTGLVVAGSLIATPAPWTRTRHRDHLARWLAVTALTEAPRNAIVIAASDAAVGSLFYLQQAEGLRPDVVVLGYGLASSSWHWQELHHMHPDLTQAPLRGPRGREGRVRRLLAANPERAVIVEDLAIATELQLRACAGGLYLRTGAACEVPAAPDLTPSRQLAAILRELDGGSPSAEGTIALTSYQLGQSLWRLGHPSAAREAFLAGVPKTFQPDVAISAEALERAGARMPVLPAWRRVVALGDPARNLFVVALLCQAAGESQAALAYARAAAAAGLPEARDALRARPPTR